MTLLMLVAIAALGLSAAHISLQEEKAARNDRDRQIAMQAAQAALADAELDIGNSPRNYLFTGDSAESFAAGCANRQTSPYLGLCVRSPQDTSPVWQTVDLANTSASSRSVQYGKFTGQILQTAAGQAPIRLPRYVIERMSYSSPADSGTPSTATVFYRITALGFGMKESTQVVLQSYFRRVSGSNETIVPVGRFGWREIPNWKELHDALTKK